MENVAQPFVVSHDDGEPLVFLGTRTWIRATGAQTGGALGVIEQIIPPGGGTPFHLHRNEDESFVIVEGEMVFFVGREQRRLTAGPGSYVFGPRMVPHGYRNDGDEPVRMIVHATPAGFEQFVLALGEPAPETGFGPDGPPDMDKLMAAAAEHGIDILGPLPD